MKLIRDQEESSVSLARIVIQQSQEFENSVLALSDFESLPGKKDKRFATTNTTISKLISKRKKPSQKLKTKKTTSAKKKAASEAKSNGKKKSAPVDKKSSTKTRVPKLSKIKTVKRKPSKQEDGANDNTQQKPSKARDLIRKYDRIFKDL